MQIQSLTDHWQFRQAGTDEWLPATAPRGVHTDLMAVGCIPDPFVADNERRVQWVAQSDWEYRRSFTVAPGLLKEDQLWLIGDGLDTLATITLNASLRVTVLNVLLDLRKKHNMTILFITHDLGQAYYLSDRVLVMYHCQIVEQGPVEEVLLNPQHDYTKGLMSDVPLLHGRESILTAKN